MYYNLRAISFNNNHDDNTRVAYATHCARCYSQRLHMQMNHGTVCMTI
jgi:hypothetical protein